jgi:ribosomal protein L40E
VIEAQSLAQKRALEGYTYQDQRGFDVAERVASNEAVGHMTNLGMVTGVGGTVGSAVGGVLNNVLGGGLIGTNAPPKNAEGTTCLKCGANLPAEAKFCMECGAPLALVKRCPNCGAEVQGSGKFCLKCGHKIEQEA